MALALLLLAWGCPTDPVADDDASDDDTADDDTTAGDDDSADDDGETLFTVQLPSEAAPDGGLAVRVFLPFPDAVRHEQGAPVAIRIEGGMGPGTLPGHDWHPTVAGFGLVVVAFLYPGGEDGGAASGGEYDYRGSTCIHATEDVIRYAAGEIPDADGLRITDRYPEAWTENLGLWGSSHGGNMSMQAIAKAIGDLPPIAWFVAYETPLGDQYVTGELDGNPFYEADSCSPTSCPIEGLEDVLRYDPTGQTGADLWSDTPAFYEGSFYVDLDGDGEFDPGAEYIPTPHTGPGHDGEEVQLHYSTELTELIFTHGDLIFGGADPPAWFAREAHAESYWGLRDGSTVLPMVHDALPDLMVIHLNAVEDHASHLPDYPHARSHVHGWIEAGHAFVRLNPDSAYMGQVADVDPALLPDNPAGAPVTWPGAAELMVPNELIGHPESTRMFGAAAMELSDRHATGNRDPDLAAVLLP